MENVAICNSATLSGTAVENTHLEMLKLFSDNPVSFNNYLNTNSQKKKEVK